MKNKEKVATRKDEIRLLIEAHLRKIEEERYTKSLEKGTPYQKREITSYIEEAKTLPIGIFIPMEFSKAYQDD